MLGFDPGLQQAKQAEVLPLRSMCVLVACASVCVLVACNECFIRKHPSAPAAVKLLCSSVTVSGAWGHGDVSLTRGRN